MNPTSTNTPAPAMPANDAAGGHADPAPKKTSRRLFARFASNRVATIALVVLVAIVLLSLFGPYLTGQDPNAQNLADRHQLPSGSHWLGTDAFGRDVATRLLYAGRVSLGAALVATVVAVGVGVPLGLAAGYLGGTLDSVLGRFVDSVMSIPNMVLVFAIIGALGPGLTQAMIAFGIVSSPIFFRLCRAVSSDLRSETFVVASRAIGCSRLRILARHILPNTLAPLLVQMSFMVGLAIVGEASLSFLGLGVVVPDSSWGSMTREAFENIYTNQWLIFPPAVIITTTILCFSLVGDGLRDTMGRNQGGRA